MAFDSESARAAALRRHQSKGGTALAEPPAGPVDEDEARFLAGNQPPQRQQPRQPDHDADDRRVPPAIISELPSEDDVLVSPEAFHLDAEDLEFMTLPGHNEQSKVRTTDDLSRHNAIQQDMDRRVQGVNVDRTGPANVVLYTDEGDPFLVPAQNARAVLRTGHAHYRCPWCRGRHAEFDANGQLIPNPNLCPRRPARKGIRCGVCGKVLYDTPPAKQLPNVRRVEDPNIIEDAAMTDLTPEQRLYAARDEHYAAFHPAEARAKGIDVDSINRREMEAARAAAVAFQARQPVA